MRTGGATKWLELYAEHTSLRRVGREATNEIRAALKALADAGILKPNVGARLQPKGRKERDLHSDHLTEELPVDRVPISERHLSEATLTVDLLASSAQLHALSVMVEGKRADGRPWVIAVHLPDDRPRGNAMNGDRQGFGACSHAALHCHVGPTLADHPKVRVPLPPLRPGELVRWVVSQAVPSEACEPAPWSAIVSDASEARSRSR